jgi:hypothetical protein
VSRQVPYDADLLGDGEPIEEEAEYAGDDEFVAEEEGDLGSDEEDGNHSIVRAKWSIDGCATLEECAQRMESMAASYRRMKAEGWELRGPVEVSRDALYTCGACELAQRLTDRERTSMPASHASISRALRCHSLTLALLTLDCTDLESGRLRIHQTHACGGGASVGTDSSSSSRIIRRVVPDGETLVPLALSLDVLEREASTGVAAVRTSPSLTTRTYSHTHTSAYACIIASSYRYLVRFMHVWCNIMAHLLAGRRLHSVARAHSPTVCMRPRATDHCTQLYTCIASFQSSIIIASAPSRRHSCAACPRGA